MIDSIAFGCGGEDAFCDEEQDSLESVPGNLQDSVSTQSMEEATAMNEVTEMLDEAKDIISELVGRR